MAVYMWFDIWGVRHFGATRHFFFYIGLVAELFILYLIAAASLPDEAGGPMDLREYYLQNRRHYWCWSRCFNSATSPSASISLAASRPASRGRSSSFEWILMCAPLLLRSRCWDWKSRTAHYLGLAALYVIMVLHYGGAAIN